MRTAISVALARGFFPVYEPGENQRCPGCRGRNWYIGRQTAECAACGTALPLPDLSTASTVHRPGDGFRGHRVTR